jgi:hypothetical protein
MFVLVCEWPFWLLLTGPVLLTLLLLIPPPAPAPAPYRKLLLLLDAEDGSEEMLEEISPSSTEDGDRLGFLW